MHGLGNDFVVFPQFTVLPKNAGELAIQLCDRNFGIGADGLVFILPSETADVRMRIMNADGTEAPAAVGGIGHRGRAAWRR